MMNSSFKLIALAAAAAALAGCGQRVTREVIREQPVVVQAAPAPQPAPQVVVERVIAPPPAPQETMPPPPASGYSWVAGHHEFRNGGWVWIPGQWVAGTVRPLPAPVAEVQPAPTGEASRWVPGYWTFANNDWVWVRGHWR
jgi:hypothetical protein